ncbi:conserved exported protein of unknown function [Pseudodesulfovibrio profundus]|uniref:Cytochrome c domain-containing protein n=1 Tax=Pseudodesulfovibrio profundus TaxID=57320 RepID=A0A2C8FCF0_9BACT|nr:cytochrome C oxidase subunit II [Pseudodesulfovibrio profundus]SOB60464.1 conserved exported protein of unknown function [Pseudodesulfovibrio profundus]
MKPIGKCILVIALSTLFALPIPMTAYSSEGHSHEEPQTDMDGFFKGASLENGSRIYFVGRTISGKPVERTGGPHWLYMHGGGCANCHGDNGQGGIVPMMCAKSSPPITMKALTSGTHKHNGTEEHHTPYTIETIRQALEKSVNPDLKPFSPCMPQWFLSDTDFRDLLYKLKELDK